MKFNNLADVLNCIKQWEQVRNNASDAARYLALGNYFTLTRNKATAANLHAYPGISEADNELYMFLIDANDDKEDSESNLFDAITICKVLGSVGNPDEIPEEDALRRINNWKQDFRSWATAQIDMQPRTPGIFKAFNIPSSYMVQNAEYTTFFALKPDGSSATGYDGDLVTLSPSKGLYYDTVRPVPPFDVYSEQSFFLLRMV